MTITKNWHLDATDIDITAQLLSRQFKDGKLTKDTIGDARLFLDTFYLWLTKGQTEALQFFFESVNPIPCGQVSSEHGPY